MADRDELAALRAENTRLIALLESHGIEWRPPSKPATPPAEQSRLSTEEKVALFRRLFRGRSDVYPVRWEGKTSSKSGYAPACANEWSAGLCEKPRIKCGDCSNRLLTPLLVENYGQVIVDECHHVGAVSFDAILKQTKAKYLLGLTATPIRAANVGQTVARFPGDGISSGGQ